MTFPAPAVLRLAVASDDEQRLIEHSLSKLFVVNAANREAREFYDGSRLVRDLGIATPPSMKTLQVVAGWPGTVVDVLEERLDWLGWDTPTDYGLNDIYAANDLDVESGMTHLDALIFGLSFVVVGAGDDGEPNPLITPASPLSMTGEWDRRMRRLSSAVSVETYNGAPSEVTLYEPDATVTYQNMGGFWRTVDRDDHRLGRVPVVLLPNRSRGSRQIGRSEITRSVRYYTEAAGRTLRGLEANREFYTVPKMVGLNIAEEMFQDQNGDPVSKWTAVQGRMWNVPPSENPDDPQPDVKQFQGASPAPYMDQVKGYAILLSAEAGIPTAYLGFQTENPASADAIRAGEARLVKRAERRQSSFGRAWREVGRLALMVRDNGAVPADYDTTVSAKWRPAATPTVSAQADAGAKQLGSVPWLAETDVGLELLGLDDQTIKRAMSQKRRANVSALIQRMADGGVGAGTQSPAQPPDVASGV